MLEHSPKILARVEKATTDVLQQLGVWQGQGHCLLVHHAYACQPVRRAGLAFRSELKSAMI